MAEGRPGLLYYRKAPLQGTAEDRLVSILKAALQGCSLLENEPGLERKIRFRTDEFLIFANDRLQAPNNEQTFRQLHAVAASVWNRLAQGSELSIDPATRSEKERLSLRVSLKNPPALKDLLERIPLAWSEYYSGGL
jgi:hypothetical protein